MARGRKAKGLGDTIEQITKVTGIKGIVDTFSEITGIDCNCDKRKETLNKLFPYNRNISCLNESDYNKLTKYLDAKQTTLTVIEQQEVSDIYYNVFNYRLQISSCSSCWRGKLDELRQVYNEYKL
jgi:hypothetical protein